jgi:hypothetical protein
MTRSAPGAFDLQIREIALLVIRSIRWFGETALNISPRMSPSVPMHQATDHQRRKYDDYALIV